MARILIDFVESDKKMIKTWQYFANPLISGLKSFKTHLYALGMIKAQLEAAGNGNCFDRLGSGRPRGETVRFKYG